MRFLATALSYSALALRYALGGLDAMGRMRETSLQELADTKNGFPLPCCGLGESVIFLHYRGEVPFSADS